VPRCYKIALAALALCGCSRGEPTSGVTTIPMRGAGEEREAWVVEADRFAAQACDCEDTSCARAAAEDFVAWRELRPEDPALDEVEQRIANCLAIAEVH
jgi:hypothetical protein